MVFQHCNFTCYNSVIKKRKKKGRKKDKQLLLFLVLEELIKIYILNLETGGEIAAKAVELN